MSTSPPDLNRLHLDRLRARLGAPPAVTGWEQFDQAMIDAYGAITGENLWVHTDPDRAVTSPFGGTIVPSSLLLARLGVWIQAVDLWLPEPATPLNYGYDRVRIPGALRVGALVRARLTLASLNQDEAGRVRLEIDAVVEGEESARPILVAQWLVMFLMG